MPKVKNFRDLSRRQKNRRLKQIHISENFVPEVVHNLNQKTNSLKNSNQKASNSLQIHIYLIDNIKEKRSKIYLKDKNVIEKKSVPTIKHST